MLFGCAGGADVEAAGTGGGPGGGGSGASQTSGQLVSGAPGGPGAGTGVQILGGVETTAAGSGGAPAAGARGPIGGAAAKPPAASAGMGGATAEPGAAAGGSAAGSSAAGSGGEPGAVAGTGGGPGAAAYPMLVADQIGTPMEIARGFRLAESPVWNPCTKGLMFSDVMGGGGKGVIHSLDAAGKVTDVMTNTGNTNGFAYDIDGSLILTQMNGHVARRDASGTVKTLEPAGTRLHTPDDVVVRSDGTIYFSDGDFCPVGNLLGFGSSLPVFMLKPGATALVNLGTVGGPNGIELSPDEKTLYVNGFGDGTVSAFDVAADGTATKQRTPFASGLGNPDSMCLDAAGNLYVGVESGLQVIRPSGEKVKLVRITAPAGECTTSGVTNCTFGGDDGKTLYLTTWTTIWKIDGMPIPGLDWIVGKKRAVCN